jgi:hypothetical protein
MFSCVQRALAGDSGVVLQDLEGVAWRVRSSNGSDFAVDFSNQDATFRYANNWMLAPESVQRVQVLNNQLLRLNIDRRKVQSLASALNERPWTPEETEAFTLLARNTPRGQLDRIRIIFEAQNFNVHDLVPDNLEYYENLIGRRQGARDIQTFSIGPGREHIESIIEATGRSSLEHLFLLAGHPGLGNDLDLGPVPNGDFADALSDVAISGDMCSRLGGLAVALQTYEQWSGIEEHVRGLTDSLINASIDQDTGEGFSATSALFILVFGELARTKVLAGNPPFWRRLAAIAHASILERALIGSRIQKGEFVRWAMNERVNEFLMQSYCDLREEPRWLPDYVAARQMKDDSLGRIGGLVDLHAESLRVSGLDEFFFSEDSTLRASIRFPQAFYPSLVEGGTEPLMKIPESWLVRLREERDGTQRSVDPSVFAGLVNGSHVYSVEAEHAGMAAKLLSIARQGVASNTTSQEVEQLLAGLASVAATTHSVDLAGELQILARVARQRDRGPDPLTELSAAFTAAAAIEDVEAWADFVGSWLLEIAYTSLSREDAVSMGRLIVVGGWLEPRLVRSCARALTAIYSI